MASNFEKVVIFNKSFGIFVSDIIVENIFDTNASLVKLRYDLIAEEIRELKEDGFNKLNLVEVIDALSDILYVVYGAGASFGIDLDNKFEIYCSLKMTSNIEKLKTLTNFNRVKLMSNTFPDKLITNLFDNSNLVDYLKNKYLSLLDKELKCLKRYILKKDMVKLSNCLVKMLDLTYSLGCEIGVDLDKSFDIVHSSNMSKLCKDEEESKQTVEWYKENETRYDTPSYRKSYDNNNYVIFNESTGKILKSINYKPANFESLVNKT